MAGKIITTHVWPPIPRRDWDWSAHREGNEESGNYGWGRTEQEAIDELLLIEDDGRDDEELRYQTESGK